MADIEQVREILAASKPGRKGSKKVWVPPRVEDFRGGATLAFDQTLTNLGWALVVPSPEGPTVAAAASHSLTTEAKGFEGTYDKALRMEPYIGQVMLRFGMVAEAIVHEMPAVQGYRIESALLAGLLVRQQARMHARGMPLEAIASQKVRALLNPPEQRFDKRYVKAAVEALIPRERRNTANWNEHVHDAVALALFRMYVPQETP